MKCEVVNIESNIIPEKTMWGAHYIKDSDSDWENVDCIEGEEFGCTDIYKKTPTDVMGVGHEELKYSIIFKPVIREI